jgi:hypothetical protein
MQQIECEIGGRSFMLNVSDRIADILNQTYRDYIYKKQVARMRKYCDDGFCGFFRINSNYFFLFEETLEERGYGQIAHELFSGFPQEIKHSLYLLFREDMSFDYLEKILRKNTAQAEKAVHTFFKKLSEKVR